MWYTESDAWESTAMHTLNHWSSTDGSGATTGSQPVLRWVVTKALPPYKHMVKKKKDMGPQMHIGLKVGPRCERVGRPLC